MTTHTLPVAGCAPSLRITEAESVGRPDLSVSGSSCEDRLTDLLARLADADAIGASRIRAWDRLQERRSA